MIVGGSMGMIVPKVLWNEIFSHDFLIVLKIWVKIICYFLRYSILFDMKVTQAVMSLCIVTFKKSFINVKSRENITVKYLGMYVKHSV